jgi:hypothetical protein
MAKKIVEVLYIGFGDYDPNVPKRDMTADEWKALDKDLRDSVLKRNLYQVVYEGGADGKGTVANAETDDPGGHDGVAESEGREPSSGPGDSRGPDAQDGGRDTEPVSKRRRS